jgi:hypothetical protein
MTPPWQTTATRPPGWLGGDRIDGGDDVLIGRLWRSASASGDSHSAIDRRLTQASGSARSSSRGT